MTYPPDPLPVKETESREERLHYLLARVTASPRWLSIGDIHTAELRISRELWEKVQKELRCEQQETAQEAFERDYAIRSGVSLEWLHKMGQRAVPCSCGEQGCEGWQMVSRESAANGE